MSKIAPWTAEGENGINYEYTYRPNFGVEGMGNDALHLDLHAGGRDSHVDGDLRTACGPALHWILHLPKDHCFRVPDFRLPSTLGAEAVGCRQHVPEGKLVGWLVDAMRQSVKIRVNYPEPGYLPVISTPPQL